MLLAWALLFSLWLYCLVRRAAGWPTTHAPTIYFFTDRPMTNTNCRCFLLALPFSIFTLSVSPLAKLSLPLQMLVPIVWPQLWNLFYSTPKRLVVWSGIFFMTKFHCFLLALLFSMFTLSVFSPLVKLSLPLQMLVSIEWPQLWN